MLDNKSVPENMANSTKYFDMKYRLNYQKFRKLNSQNLTDYFQLSRSRFLKTKFSPLCEK